MSHVTVRSKPHAKQKQTKNKTKNLRFFNVRNRTFHDKYDVVAESTSPCEIELPFLPKIISCNHPFDYSDLL